MHKETKLKKFDRAARIFGESGISFLATYGRMLIPRYGDLAKDCMKFHFKYNLYLLSAWYVTDLCLYTAASKKMYNSFGLWENSYVSAACHRGVRNLSQALVSAGGLQLFYYTILSNSLIPQIATAAGLFVLKGLIESVYEYLEYQTTHDRGEYDFLF